MHNTARLRGTDSVQIMQVIETRTLAGRGTSEDPYMEVRQYWDMEGSSRQSTMILRKKKEQVNLLFRDVVLALIH